MATMTTEQLNELTMAQIKEALVEAGVELPGNVDDMKKGVLVGFASTHLTDGAPPPEPTPEPVEEEELPEPDPIPEGAEDVYSELVKNGFESKDEVKSYLEAVRREKLNHKARLNVLAKREEELEKKEAKTMKREKDVDETAVKLQAKLDEAKKQTEYYTNLKKKLAPLMND